MDISIIFDTAFHGRAEGAVWIIESVGNRAWFARQSDLGEQSALFTPEEGAIGHGAIRRSIWNVQEHYPQWARIHVIGISLTDDLSADLRADGRITRTARGFTMAR